MGTQKTFVGPKLRQLRKGRGQTQAQMAETLGLSATYINLLENNQRSLSVQVLMRLAEGYGVDWRELVEDDAPTHLADLRNTLQDPIFGDNRADLHELRAALDHCPTLAQNFLSLHRSYRALSERMLALDEQGGEGIVSASPETTVHDLFRRNRNYFDGVERAAEAFRASGPAATDEIYAFLKAHLHDDLGIAVETVSVRDLPDTLRYYDEDTKRLLLSEGLDHLNRLFQLCHMIGLIGFGKDFDAIIREGGIDEPRGHARARIELANYFAAAVLMPYEAFREEAMECRYDLDYLAARFGVSFEQVCHRVTTLQRDGAQGVPLFFMRIDKAGNVTKRFNATSFNLAEHGGACPRLDVHMVFRMPGRILPQLVEMPDGSRYFTINRTVDRPALGYRTQDQRLAVTIGCAVEHADAILYASHMPVKGEALVTPIGINCRLCPRTHCAQRAQQPIHLDLPMDERRRGTTRFEN
jgi:predicted transcriptional regulator/plasmid maintenance system antidote protein VapI